MDIIYDPDFYERLRNFLSEYSKLIEKLEKGTLSDEEREIFMNTLKDLMNTSQIHLNLYENIRAFKEYFFKHSVWNPHRISRIQDRFISFIVKKFEELKGKSHIKNPRVFMSNKLPFFTGTQEKIEKLKVIISNQLQHYSKTGERLLSIQEASMKAGWGGKMTGTKYTKIILEQTIKDLENAKLIYDMIFGSVRTSYQKIKQQCISKGLLLTTTSTQWFEMMKNREGTPASKFYVEVQCTAENHKSTVRVDQISGCFECMLLINLPKGRTALGFQDFLKVASEHNLQLMAFYDDSQQLTEDEFNDLLEEYQSQHQDSEDYKSRTTIAIILKWKCLDCDHVFETSYRNIQQSKVNRYCPKCVSSIDQQRTLEKAEEVFQDYITQSFYSNWQLPKFLPNRILLMDKYRAISDPRVHVDCFGMINVHGKEFKIAIEHQGIQHYSFSAILDLVQSKDIARGIYKPIEEYKEMF
ncbi:MAG: hypothetical protein ACTSPO_16045, partial [Candidatus Heimdallarchaeaceae archaeon]